MNILANKEYGAIQSLNKSLLDNGQFHINSNGINKALEAGEGVGADMTNLDELQGGRAITVENIDTVLKSTAEQRKDLVFYNLLRSKPIYAVLDQYMVLSDHGLSTKRHSFGTFRDESSFPASTDVTLERKVDSTKFIRNMRDLTHVMEQVSTMADQHEILNYAGAMAVLTGSELSTIFGNSAAIPNEFDGLFTKLLNIYNDGYESIVDCRATGASSGSKGGTLQEELLDVGAERIMNSFGRATNMIMPTKVKSDLNQILPVSRRVMLPEAQQVAANQMLLGQPAAGFYTDFGSAMFGGDPQFKFNPSIDSFFPSGESNDVKAPTADYPTTALAPTTPSGVVAAVAASGALDSKFYAGDAGDYWYKVSALNADGVSVAESIASAATVAADQKVTLTITGADSDITGYSIYRSALGAATAADCRWIADIAATLAVGDTDFVDLNLILPGTSIAILISNEPGTDAIDYRQLMPFVRMQLPFGLNGIVGYPYLYMLYKYLRTPKLENPRTGGAYHQLYTNIRWSQSTF